jgi:hypothetical protein
MKTAFTLAAAGLLASSIAANAAVADGVITHLNFAQHTVTLDTGATFKLPNAGGLNGLTTGGRATVVYQTQGDGVNLASEIIQRK